MAEVNIHTIIGYVKSYTDNKLQLVVLNETLYQFTVNAGTVIVPDTITENDIISVSFVDEYNIDTPATKIEAVPNTIMGTLTNILVYALEVEAVDGTRYSFTTTDNTSYNLAAPVVGEPIMITYRIDGETYIATSVQCVPEKIVGVNQVGGAPAHIPETEFPVLKKEGEYVYPSDWNALVRAVQTLNANAALLAEVVAKHNALDADTLTIAQSNIIDSSVLNRHLADAAVTGDKIHEGTLTSAHYADKSITDSKVADTVLGAMLHNQIKEVLPTTTFSTATGTVVYTGADEVRQIAVEVPLNAAPKVFAALIGGSLYIFHSERLYSFFYIGGTKSSSGAVYPVIRIPNTTVSNTGAVTKALQGFSSWHAWYLEYPEFTAPTGSGEGPTGLIGCHLKTTDDNISIIFTFEQRRIRDKYWDSDFNVRVFGC